MSNFHERLRTLRESRNIQVATMLEVLDMTRRNYQRYEKGEVDPPSSNLVKLADFFQVSTDYLLGRTDKP